MESGRDQLLTLLKRLDGRYIPDMAPDRMSDWEAMRIHVYHDTQVEQRVSRRFEQYGAATRGGMSQNDTSSAAMMGGDPMVQGKATEVYFQSVSRNRITLQILERTLSSLASTKGRKSLILVSEGFIYDPNLDEFKKTVQASRRSNVAIYFLDTRGLTGMPDYFTAQFGPPIDTQDIGAVFMETLEASEGAESLAADTGSTTCSATTPATRSGTGGSARSRSSWRGAKACSSVTERGTSHRSKGARARSTSAPAPATRTSRPPSTRPTPRRRCRCG